MIQDRMLFTVGQFAKLHHVNKRTLHYYDDIGLFSPTHKGDNGYRYYTYLQSPILEMILTLRELGMTIDEISKYMIDCSIPKFKLIVESKTQEIDKSIKRLKEIKKLLKTKHQALTLCENLNLSELDIIECEEEYLLLSQSITGSYDDKDFAILLEHMQELRGYRLFNKNFGTMISIEKVRNMNFDEYDYFFTKVAKDNTQQKLLVKPSGRYIRGFCKGDWDKLEDVYKSMIEFADEQSLTLCGYAYEEGINELMINDMDEYITQIMIRCE